MAIPRGTTPTLTLTFNTDNLDLTTVNNVYVTFRYGKGETLTKTGNELAIGAKSVDVFLSQAETLKFTEGTVEVQANWTYSDGRRAASSVESFYFGKQLLDKVVP